MCYDVDDGEAGQGLIMVFLFLYALDCFGCYYYLMAFEDRCRQGKKSETIERCKCGEIGGYPLGLSNEAAAARGRPGRKRNRRRNFLVLKDIECGWGSSLHEIIETEPDKE